jgi:hypothetical protein
MFTKRKNKTMFNHESDPSLIAVIAGKTASAKTRTAEATTGVLRKKYNLSACFMSIGDGFRFMNEFVPPTTDPNKIEYAAKKALEQATVIIDNVGRVRLEYHHKIVEQTFKNGNEAGRLGTNPHVVFHFDQFLHENISGKTAGNDIVIFDAREPRNAHVLLIPHASDETRLAIRKYENPECTQFSDEIILDSIMQRDKNDEVYLNALDKYDVNVINYQRQTALPKEDMALAERISHILVSFKTGALPGNIGTIDLP